MNISDIPSILRVLQKSILKNLDKKSAKEFSSQFIKVLKAIPVGADLSRVYYKWAARLVKRLRVYAFNDGKVTIDRIIELFEKGDGVKKDEWKEAADDAFAAFADAFVATYDTYTYTNANANATYVAANVAYAVVLAANLADDAVFAAATEAVKAYAYAADDTAANVERIKQRDDLLELLAESAKEKEKNKKAARVSPVWNNILPIFTFKGKD